MSRTIRASVAVVAMIALGATGACGPCGYNTFAEAEGGLYAESVAPPVGSGFGGTVEHLSLAINEGSWESQVISWRISTRIPREEVVALHLHEGAPGLTGPVVYEFPPPSFFVSDSFHTAASADFVSDVSIESVLGALLEGRLYLDVHTLRMPAGAYRANLRVRRSEERSAYHCS